METYTLRLVSRVLVHGVNNDDVSYYSRINNIMVRIIIIIKMMMAIIVIKH